MLSTNLAKTDEIEFGWWVEIITLFPACSYYFGPFANILEAAAAKVGYLEDLQQEGAKGITLRIKQCQPETLTRISDRE
ncbi:hypothetical protein NIES2119_10960 [[Phormidium ambiguum] IAM M-71]|uniref:DUF1816 domain-containing protein n=1 Tax=[Phormidium ambiguum] IAM M-71 TaxID=454136 RepID=A0A1U7ILK2_9CYAN|nr:DUF1816 domain-containing protein [Phormidium ambiguum]OKH38073.1 hypothetical protein NIES2119_10960 [Phormidium ambiguum IAM M-71]